MQSAQSSKPQEPVYRVESKPGRFWYPRPCGHVTSDRALVDEPCSHCESNADGYRQEQLLELELSGLAYVQRVAAARRAARR